MTDAPADWLKNRELRDRPTYSARLLNAFASALQDHGEIGRIAAGAQEQIGGDRVLVEVAHQALQMAVQLTGDTDLGLKAARKLTLGDAGAVDYVVSSASTVKDAIDQVSRFVRLINDVLEVRLVLDGQLATIRLDNDISLPRAAVDFEVGGLFRTHVCSWFTDELSEVMVSFTHAAPADTSEYERTFSPAKVRFNAPFLSISFDRRLLDHPLGRADSKLQEVIVPYASQELEHLSYAKTVTADVRVIVAEQLRNGGPDVSLAASRLGMSVRTLARRLEREGTTFRNLVDDARRRMALEYVGKRDLGFSEVSYRLGFSHVAGFHRAFRRWTGRTPLEYRRSRGR